MNKQTEEKISQYTDDANLWSSFDESSVKAIVKQLKRLRENTGLKVNYEKSVIYRVGSIRNTHVKLNIFKKFKWSSEVIDTLGILVNISSLDDIQSNNYSGVFEKAIGAMKTWKIRCLTIIGKIQVVNSLINLLFVHRMQVLPLMNKDDANRLVWLITEFIWNGHKPKIQNEYLMFHPTQGGRNLGNMEIRDKMLKIEWISHLCQDKDSALEFLALLPHSNGNERSKLFGIVILRKMMLCNSQKIMPFGETSLYHGLSTTINNPPT